MRLFVLARNYQDFKRWCWEKGIPELHATYVASAERVIGIRLTPNQIVRLPGHEEHPAYVAIDEVIQHRLEVPA